MMKEQKTLVEKRTDNESEPRDKPQKDGIMNKENMWILRIKTFEVTDQNSQDQMITNEGSRPTEPRRNDYS